MQRSCAIIIPVYNEDRAIASTVQRLQEISKQVPDYDFEIICINDGSSDRSGEILAGLEGITVLAHEVNRGYGAALRTGLDYCNQDWVFITDADGTYPLEDLVHLLKCAESGFDMVVGSREGAGIMRNPLRRLARWILREMVHRPHRRDGAGPQLGHARVPQVAVHRVPAPAAHRVLVHDDAYGGLALCRSQGALHPGPLPAPDRPLQHQAGEGLLRIRDADRQARLVLRAVALLSAGLVCGIRPGNPARNTRHHRRQPVRGHVGHPVPDGVPDLCVRRHRRRHRPALPDRADHAAATDRAREPRRGGRRNRRVARCATTGAPAGSKAPRRSRPRY